MEGAFNNIKVQGICSVVPSAVEENRIYGAIQGERRVKKQIQLTGVEERHISERTQRASDLCYLAAKKLIDHLKWNREEIKVLLFITQGSDFVVPSTAFFLQKRLGLPKDCICYDINLGCTAFNVGIQSIASLMQMCKNGEKGLLLVGDTLNIKSPYYAYSSDNIAKDMLFGSAGSCTALEKAENNEIIYSNFSDGDRYKAIFGLRGLPSTMDGSAVFSFTINDVADSLKEFKNNNGLTEDKIDYYVFHQAQKLILDDLMEGCGIEHGRDLRSFMNYGNAAGCSIPLSVCANVDKLAGKGVQRFLFCGFGVGLSWGCIYTEVDTDNILPVEISDDYYEFRPETTLLYGLEILIVGADCDMGEWLTRYFIDSGAHTLLLGADDKRLKTISEAQYIKTSYISEYEEKAIGEGIENYKDEKGVCPGTIVILGFEKMDSTDISDLLTKLISSGVELYKVVIVSKVKSEADLKTEGSRVEAVIKSVKEKYETYVNAVIYPEDKTNIDLIRDSGQKWYTKYVEHNCPYEMSEASYISKAIEYLISGMGVRTDRSILFVK